MPLKTYLNRVSYIDNLIRTKATGNVKQLAKKLNLSQRAVYDYLSVMKELGCPIKYCRKRNSYYYETDGNVIISFFDKKIGNPFSGGG